MATTEAKTLAAVEELGEAAASDLTKVVPELATRVTLAPGTKHEATTGLTSRVLNLMGMEGLLVRGRPKGRWTSSQHRWSSLEARFGAPLAAIPVEEARAELVRRWLDRFGPGTLADVKWWTGWTMGATRAAVAALDTEAVEVDGSAALVLAGDTEPVPDPEPWVALLPGLDPTPMGWKERDWYLGEHRSHVFDSTGNVGPTIWVDGRIAGGWAHLKTGEVAFHLLEDVGAERTRDGRDGRGGAAGAARTGSDRASVPVAPRPAPVRVMDATRVDRWVWAVRLYKTRADATDACKGGHVTVNGKSAKPSTPVAVGSTVEARAHGRHRIFEVTQVIDKRVGAAIAAGCYVDHSPPEPEQDRVRVASRERGSGRPTKRERRQLDRWRGA